MQPRLSHALNSPWGVALLLTLLCPLLFTLGLADQLALRPHLIQQDEFYRLLSGHYLHTNLWHLLMNLAGLWIILAVFNLPFTFFSTLLLLLLLSGMIGLEIIWFFPAITGYVGLSGLLHGLFAFAALREGLLGIRLGWLLLGGIIAKVIYEQLAGASETMTTMINAKVAIDAHLAGVIAGVILAGGYSIYHRWRHSSDKSP
ncbi:rhombosortase [Shewanella sp. NFH-SH190041]|uniref:rhombosortase n=1 Tax=Shewanella sp. NFH-SH190041 TaxID=2950245 RepID=UPI0021C43329|nr:rhombosortase [Shewanella sp. NFH-SH190041]BDM64016.1 rhombosortase [Shewanella sp. NFH-SH190041]